jgi:hypothetical protein
MQLRQLSGWQVIPLLISITLVIGVIGMLIRVPRTPIASAAILLSGAGVASWIMGLA